MVVLKYCDNYDLDIVKQKIKESLDEFHLFDNINEDTRVFIKTNCVGPFSPEMGITTHPVVLKAVIQLVKEKTNKIVVGDNPAVRELTFTLKKCGLYDVIKEENVEILDGTIFTTIHNSNPKIYSDFEISKQMIDTDVLINLPKVKTHTLAYMTCAQKNFFGLIYGLNKSAWHVKAANPIQFGEAINDLYGALLESFKDKTMIHIADGIIGLEGEGPSTGGRPNKSNMILTSTDAVSLDRVCVDLVHLDYKKLFINQIANERGYGNGDINTIEIKGDDINLFNDVKYLEPKDAVSSVGLRILKIKPLRNVLLEHPAINKDKCIKCGECTRICPPKAMTIKTKEYPTLKSLNCIRCWCCAEVCPQNAIDKTTRPLIGRIVFKTSKEKKEKGTK